MKTIVFLETQKSGSSREAIKAAEHLGYFTVLLTERDSFLEKRLEFPDVHLMQLCNLNKLEDIRTAINALQTRCLKICAILSFVDPHCYTASLLATELGINKFSTEAIGNMTNKIKSRNILLNSTYDPYFLIVSDDSNIPDQEIKRHLPIVVKSPNSSGSKDVYKANSYSEFIRSKNKLFSKYPNEVILIEEFLDGPQYLVETIVCNGEIHIVAVIQQEITFDKRFIVTGYNLLLDAPEDFYQSLKETVESIIKLHGMVSGPCHLEMRLVNENWKLIEINPRISGGGMNHLLRTGFGINLVQETIKLALGMVPNVTPKYKNYTFSQYLTVSETGILEKVTGRNRARKCTGVKYVYVKPRKGTLLIPPISMGNRYAYVIATGSSENEARDHAKFAASQIHFWLKPAEEVIQSSESSPQTTDLEEIKNFFANREKLRKH